MTVMGRVVNNIYGSTDNHASMTLEIISAGLYQIEILFDAEKYEYLRKFNWCFEATKGLVYCMDLSMETPTKMGHKTPRIYLRNYLQYLDGNWANGKPKSNWPNKDLTDYRLSTK